MAWTLTYGGVTKTFAEWGIGSLKRVQVSQVGGSVTFVQSGPYDGTPLFAIDAVLTIAKDGEVWHIGPVLKVPSEGTAKSEAMMYEVGDPFWFLENLPYEQSIVMAGGATPTTRVTMFAVVEGGATVKSSAEAMIATAVALAVTAGAAMQVAFVGDFSISPAVQDLRDPTCAEVIQEALRMVPDAAGGWDYSTTPPTLRITRRASATVRTVDAADKVTCNVVKVTPRDDLRREKVAIYYEVTNTNEGQELVDIVADIAGDGSPFRTLKATIPLSGYTKTTQRQSLEVRSIPTNNASWWRRHVTTLEEATDLTITGQTMTPADGGGTFSNEIVGGGIPGWMGEGLSGQMKLTAKASYKLKAEDDTEFEFKDDVQGATVHATNMGSGTYEDVSFEPAEPVPTGVAAFLLASLSVLQYEGAVHIHKRECGFIARPGDVLCIMGGAAAWETMNAQVQQVTEDVDGGKTVITFGPPSQLGPQDIIEMLSRFRKPTSDRLQERESGIKGGGVTAQGSRGGANENGNSAGVHWRKVVTVNSDGTRKLTLSAEDGVKVEKDEGTKIEILTGTGRILITDEEGNSAEIKATGISFIDPTGAKVAELKATGLTVSEDGKTTTVSPLQLLHDDGAGNTNSITEEQMVISNGDQLGIYSVDKVEFTGDAGETTLSNGQLLMESEAGAIANLNTDQLLLSDGEDKQGIYEADSLSLSDGDDGAELSKAGLDITDGTKSASLSCDLLTITPSSGTLTASPEGGFAATHDGRTVRTRPSGGLSHTITGGSLTAAAVSGSTITMTDTPWCDSSGTTTKKVLRAV